MHNYEVNFKGNKENGCHTSELVVTLIRKMLWLGCNKIINTKGSNLELIKGNDEDSQVDIILLISFAKCN